MTITARYAGKCAGCGKAFAVGAQIEWSKGVSRHPGCTTSESASAPKVRTPATRKSYPAGSHEISGRRTGRTDRRYEVGAVVHAPKVSVPGGGPDGHWYMVLGAEMRRPNEDNGDFDWREIATVRAATAEEALAPSSARAVSDSRKTAAEALPRSIQAAHDGPDARLMESMAPAGATRIVIGSRAAGSETVYVTHDRAWYVQSSYDDGAAWTALLTDEMRAMVAVLVPEPAITATTTPV